MKLTKRFKQILDSGYITDYEISMEAKRLGVEVDTIDNYLIDNNYKVAYEIDRLGNRKNN